MAKTKKTLIEVVQKDKENISLKLQTDATNKQKADTPLTDAVGVEIRTFIDAFRKTIHQEWKSSIKAYTMDKTDRYLMLLRDNRQNDSNAYTPFIKNLVDKTFNRLYDTEIDFLVSANNKQDRRGEKHIKTLMQNGFTDVTNRKNFFSAVKSQIITGNGFAKAWLIAEGDDFRFKIDNVPVFNLYFNINMDFYESGMPIIERSIKSMDQIIKECEWLYSPTKLELDAAVYLPKPFSNHDDARVWDMWVRHNDITSTFTTQNSVNNFNEDNLYKVEKYNNNVSEVIWRYTDTNVTLYVNGYKWYDGDNPLGCHPYINLMYDPSYGRNISRGIASTHLDGQYAINALNNKALDDVRLSSTNMWVIEGSWDIDGVDEEQIFYPTNGKVIRIPNSTKFRRFEEFKPMDANIYQSIGNIISQGENEVGLNALTGWAQWGSKERSSFAAQSLVNQTQLTVKPAVEGISLWLTRISVTWQKMVTKFIKDRWLDNKIELRTYDGKYVKLDTKYLNGKYSIQFSNKSLVSLNSMQSVLDKVNMLNQLLPFLKDLTDGRVLIDQRYLLKEIFRELWYEDDIILSDDEYNAQILKNQIANIDLQIALMEKEMELERKKQEMQAVVWWVPQLPWVASWQQQGAWLNTNSWQTVDMASA